MEGTRTALHCNKSYLPTARTDILTLCLCCSRLRSPLPQVVQWLWQVVAELSPEEKKLFLKFFTGSDRSPIGGLGNLRCVIQVCERRRAGMGVVCVCGVCVWCVWSSVCCFTVLLCYAGRRPQFLS